MSRFLASSASTKPRHIILQLQAVCVISVIALLAPFSHIALYGFPQNTDAESREDRGLELAHAGDLAGAESQLRAAVALAPKDAEFLSNLATVLAMEKKLEDSANFFERALKLDRQSDQPSLFSGQPVATAPLPASKTESRADSETKPE